MTIPCPKCQSDNAETARFCAECGTELFPDIAIQASVTKTIIITPSGTILAMKYRILKKLGERGMSNSDRIIGYASYNSWAGNYLEPNNVLFPRWIQIGLRLEF